jgi:hypothetical protein
VPKFNGNLTCGGRCARCLAAKAPPAEPMIRTAAIWDTKIEGHEMTGPQRCRPMGVFDGTGHGRRRA